MRDDTFLWAMLGAVALFFTARIALSYRPRAAEATLLRFVGALGLPANFFGIDDPAAVPVARRVLAVTRAQSVGALSGVSLAAAVLVVSPDWRPLQTGAYVTLVLAALGLILGALTVSARQVLLSSRDAAPRVARASAPVLADYVPALSRVLPRVLFAAAIILALAAAAVSSISGIDAGGFIGIPVVAALLGALCLLVLAEALDRFVLSRAQPATTESELMWHEALRADMLLSLRYFVSIVALTAFVIGLGSVLVVTGGAGASWPGTVASQVFIWGLLISMYGYAFSHARRHFMFRLWPDVVLREVAA